MSEYSLYIGNLPADLPKDKYIALLSDALGGCKLLFLIFLLHFFFLLCLKVHYFNFINLNFFIL